MSMNVIFAMLLLMPTGSRMFDSSYPSHVAFIETSSFGDTIGFYPIIQLSYFFLLHLPNFLEAVRRKNEVVNRRKREGDNAVR